jgi:hypothetical protein
MDSADIEDQAKNDISSKEIEHASIQETPTFTLDEEKALVRKIDLTLLPTIWVMYLLSYLDRTKYVATSCALFAAGSLTNSFSQHRKCKDIRHGN